ncbi:ferrochelatase [Sphingobium sufflavum]|uniref:ferrochelatase n=1 Tax=Sphingobium sufflavum TaxID=1129547 RepID=UPI001F1B9308|nr:ferrochelatase [Sphingobium sufflavum]MCE7798637.1 ferrochelatase [Sphingobium sufflavum]
MRSTSPGSKRHVGVLLVNLGTPDAPTPAAVKRYLREFLSDPRVVEIPQIVWQPILRGIILNTRPKKSAHAYQQVWMPDGSPLAVYTRRIAEGLADGWGEGVIVDWAMRYGNPSIGSRIGHLMAAGCDRILIVPLYPQYCGATTASVMDGVTAALATMRHQPTIRVTPPWHDDPAYIGALAQSVRDQVAALPFVPQRILASFHGMPERTRALGDPYHDQCLHTAQLLGQTLGRPVDVSFQSRFGRAKWLEPETESVLAGLVADGVRDVAVLTPGFAADCLETLEEIGLRGKEVFLEAGGQNFALLRCLNADPVAIHLYRTLIRRELAGWVDTIEG